MAYAVASVLCRPNSSRLGEDVAVNTKGHPELKWLGDSADQARLRNFGYREGGGGAHQSKTLMLRELTLLFGSLRGWDADFRQLILEDNVLGKDTASAAKSVLRNIVNLYGLSGPTVMSRVLLQMWRQSEQSRPFLALIAALCRDPLLRTGSRCVIEAPVGASVRWTAIAEELESIFPQRFSQKMLRSLAQNCASSWTQAGLLQGKMKIRARVHASPEAAAFAALVATICGFSGPAMLDSAWFKVLDLGPDAALDRLRSAESRGLARVRAAGDVIEIAVRQPLARTLGVAEVEYV